jgi:zinc protease
MLSIHLTTSSILRVLMLCAATLVGAATIGASSAHAITIQEVKSKGGITAWLVEEHAIPLIAMSFSFEGGSAADPADKPGLAHFLSGMLDEGAGELDSNAFQTREDDLAMKLSFDTGLDNFSGSLQTLTANRAGAFDLLRLALTKPRFDAAPLEKVRRQILLSVRGDAEDPEAIAGDVWMHAAFGAHPYSRDDKGTVEAVNRVTGDDLRQLSKRLFAREGLKIAVVGDISADELAVVLDQIFGDLPERSGMPKIAETAVQHGPVVKIVDRDIPQSVIQFGLPGIKRKDPDFMAGYVMNFILGEGGFGSRLMEEVREKRGLTYGISTGLYPMERSAAFVGNVSTVNERASETIEVTKREIARMAAEGPTEQELAEAKTYITGSYPLRFDSSRKIAAQLLSIQEQELGIDYVNKRNSLVQAVSIDDVRRVAKRLLRVDDLIITIVGRPKDVAAVPKS